MAGEVLKAVPLPCEVPRARVRPVEASHGPFGEWHAVGAFRTESSKFRLHVLVGSRGHWHTCWTLSCGLQRTRVRVGFVVHDLENGTC